MILDAAGAGHLRLWYTAVTSREFLWFSYLGQFKHGPKLFYISSLLTFPYKPITYPLHFSCSDHLARNGAVESAKAV